MQFVTVSPIYLKNQASQRLDENKIYVTKEGYEKKKSEFDHLMNEEFAENARDLGEASVEVTLENAEYKAARGKQAMLVGKAERMESGIAKDCHY